MPRTSVCAARRTSCVGEVDQVNDLHARESVSSARFVAEFRPRVPPRGVADGGGGENGPLSTFSTSDTELRSVTSNRTNKL